MDYKERIKEILNELLMIWPPVILRSGIRSGI